ncbi:GspE/PulE family protein [Pontiella agarivorans]|uniref:GspE/PulE family protein n=1 Tax=Pontiella agarivorans TaxID=3038953 RepID=A0ABU5MXY9_9BACT|nr:GspE/PulE family protein [Pontiella agarivorans]MDZ8119039.1 GspE/PulE family protein [Pontiella agarivorans]
MIMLNHLVDSGRISREQAESIHGEHLAQGRSIRDIILDQHDLREPEYLQAVADALNSEIIDLENTPTFPNPGNRIPSSLVRMYFTTPVKEEDGAVIFAVCDYPASAVADDMAFILSQPIGFVVAPEEQIKKTIHKLFGETDESTPAPSAGLEQTHFTDLEHAACSTPVIQFVNSILQQAVSDGASDIHFEPFEKEFKIRCRVDGALFEMPPPPIHLALPIISRIKVIAGLDIAESRLPQDGRIELAAGGHTIDFRVSTLPTQFGESVVLRVLDRSNVQLELDRIGFPEDIYRSFTKDIEKPNGIVIVTGPTGSGKTTTLYAALQRINKTETKILTAEDPVEYDVEGIIQLPVRDNIGLTFASALRSFLRQDPDVIMVGEIRDLDTAQIAVQASLTGHLVFTTLHTNDAAGAITRLIDMDVEPYLIASTLEAVMGQRLVRTICPDCKTAYTPDDEMLQLLELTRAQIGDRPFYRGSGCETCGGSGYSGRCALFEYMPINETLRSAIVEKQPTLALRRKAIALGMRTLREDGIRLILDGRTTVEEVVQYT